MTRAREWASTADLHNCSQSCKSERTVKEESLRSFKRASTESENPVIPAEDLFDFGDPKTPPDNKALPTVAQCATHLELLQTFQQLRLQVLASTILDQVLGIIPEPATVYRKVFKHGSYQKEPHQIADKGFSERRETKWPLYLQLASARFLIWLEAFEKELGEKDFKFHLPPIDILMVWHSLLLNPGWYRKFEGEGANVSRILRIRFPWEAIHEQITSQHSYWTLEISDEDSAWFQEKTGLHIDLLSVLTKEITAPAILEVLKGHGRKPVAVNSARGIKKNEVSKLVDEAMIKRKEFTKFDQTFIQSLDRATQNSIVNKMSAAVQRQASFVAKMDKQLWIRSPAVRSTLVRAVFRYSRFLKLMKLYPGTMFVPTLDIDIVWHTHQCTPIQYLESTKALAGRFIDHDDKVGQVSLDNGLQKTKDLYQVRFGGEYSYCTCWDCEALRSYVAQADDSGSSFDLALVAATAEEKVRYYYAVEYSRRKGEKLLPLASSGFTVEA